MALVLVLVVAAVANLTTGELLLLLLLLPGRVKGCRLLRAPSSSSSSSLSLVLLFAVPLGLLSPPLRLNMLLRLLAAAAATADSAASSAAVESEPLPSCLSWMMMTAAHSLMPSWIYMHKEHTQTGTPSQQMFFMLYIRLLCAKLTCLASIST